MKDTMPSSPEPMDKKGPSDWETKNWADTVMEGERIKKDPKKMKHVKKHLKKDHMILAKITSVQQLRDRAKEMEGSPEEEASETPEKEAQEKASGKD